MSNAQPHHGSKARILDAALRVIRTKGYSATTIDDVCATAGLTKGSFFHHFKSKDELALAATAHFAAMADGLFAAEPYRTLPDPRERVIGYVKFRKSILTGDLPEFTCLLTLCRRPLNPSGDPGRDKYISARRAGRARHRGGKHLRPVS